MSVDELDPLADDQVGDRNRLLRIAGVVLDHDLDLAAVNSARVVDGGGGGLGAALHLVADRGDRAGHRACDGDDDVVGEEGVANAASATPASDRIIVVRMDDFSRERILRLAAR